MPADYVACRDSYIKKGVSEKTAKARCAAWFYKKHGYTVNEAHKRGRASADVPLPEELVGEDLSDLDWELVEFMLANLDEFPDEADSTKPVKLTKREEKMEVEIAGVANSKIIGFNIDMLDDLNIVEIIATKVGAKAYTDGGLVVVWTDKALRGAEKSWKLKRASMNHEDVDHGRILASFMDGDLLRMVVKVSDTLKVWIKKAGNLIGVSIEAVKVKINKEQEIISATGSGITFVFPPHEPACTIEEGCGIVAIETKEVEAIKRKPPESGNLPEEGKKILDRVYTQCRGNHPADDPEDEEKCSKIAWYAVKKAGFEKKDDGTWVKSTLPEPFDIEAFIKNCPQIQETVDNVTTLTSTVDSLITITTFPSHVWYNISSTTTDGSNYRPWQEIYSTYPYPEMDWTKYKIWISPNAVDNPPPYNIDEENKNPEQERKGEIMAEEPKTICVEKHEQMIKEKDAQIETLNRDMETLKATVAKFEVEKKNSMLDALKAEKIDVEPFKNESIEVLDVRLQAIKAYKKSLEEAPEENSGVKVTATETKTDDTGKAVSNAVETVVDEVKQKAEEEKKYLEFLKTEAEKRGFR